MKAKKSASFFTDEENARIRTAIEKAEANTSGEIVAMVVDRSDSYREAEILGAVLTAAFCGFLLEIAIQIGLLWISNSDWGSGLKMDAELVLHGVSLWTYIPLVIILFFPLRFLFRRREELKLPFVGGKRIDEAVRERAVRGFFEKKLYRTRDETGILIFLSLLEHKVWILADRGINSRLPHDQWNGLARELSLGMREKRACEALCSVISSCGEELARHFPRKDDDTNELPDHVLHQ
jgi:putative membrane protein